MYSTNISNVNPYWESSDLLTKPFGEGASWLRQAVLEEEAVWGDRLVCGLVGAALLIPIINTIVYIAIKELAKSNFLQELRQWDGRETRSVINGNQIRFTAENELIKVMDQNSAILDLSSYPGLRSLPPCIGQLTQLRYIDIRNTQVQAFPREILQLEEIETIFAQNCPIQHVLIELNDLPNLTFLDLSGAPCVVSGSGVFSCINGDERFTDQHYRIA